MEMRRMMTLVGFDLNSVTDCIPAQPYLAGI